jgi:hypothetical protein
MALKPRSRSAVLILLRHVQCARVSAMDRGRRCVRSSLSPSPLRRRPSPAAPQPPPGDRFQRRGGAASLRPTAQASIAVSASHRTKHTHTISRTNARTVSCALRAHKRKHTCTLFDYRYTHTRTDMPTYENTHMHTHALRYTLNAHIFTDTQICVITGKHTACDDIVAGTLPRSHSRAERQQDRYACRYIS